MNEEVNEKCGKCKRDKVDGKCTECGRPLKFKTVDELIAKAEKYFETAERGLYTITGLALALDTTRQVLINYEQKDEFIDTIKKYKSMIENDYELSLRKQGRSGDIFGLKNFGWKDKSELDQNNKGNITIEVKNYKD